ncbi:MAG TPA: shikimate kinase [Tenuifilaceae bacterium]|nr:shikimate kinase [Tenuifilaceae bacterium]
MKVFLIGFMASGKSTIGEELASVLGYKFIDLDTYIEEKHKKSVKMIFEIYGEDHFRTIENEALKEVSQIEGNIIVASGGGTSCFYNSVDFMNEVGLTIYLRVEVGELLARLIESKKDRPLLWGKSKEELNKYIIRVLDERKKYYEQAKITVQMDKININQLASTIRAISA